MTDYSEHDDATTADLDDLSRKLIGWIKKDMPHVAKWRKEAREDFEFYAGDQWNQQDAKELASKDRPALTFNRVAPLVNAVVGSEINNRREVRFIPREQGDAQANEVLSSAAEWFRDECGAEDEESDAFQDDTICGMGWTDTRLEFDDDPDGAPLIERIDPLEMGWDRHASKPGLVDSRRFWRIRQMSYDEAKDLTGETDKTKLHASWARDLDNPVDPHDQDQADLYAGDQDGAGDEQKDNCLLAEIRWLEKETYIRGPDIDNPNAIREYARGQEEAAELAMLERYGVPGKFVEQKRSVLRRAFIGKEVLGKPDSPMVPSGLFGWECMTGYRDSATGHFYGVVKAAKDPQRWSNKFFSQVMFLLNSQSKGGIVAERGAFEDDREAEASWAKSDAITWANVGALSGQNPKIVPKSPSQFPAGFFTLFQETKEAINEVTGLSQEFLGTREVTQAGVLEYQRRQSSLNILASLFNSLRRYRKRQGRTMLHLIQEHLSDGRLIRIVGDGLGQYVPLTREEVADKKYDIIVDDSPSSPNEKERTWQILMQMLPMVKDLIDRDMALELLALSPLPASLVTELRKKAEEAPQQPTPEMIEAQAKKAEFDMEMAGKQADLQAKQTEAQIDGQMKGLDLMVKQNEAAMDAEIDREKLQTELYKLALDREKAKIARDRVDAQKVNAAKQ
ncbi:MAG: hypothetical protein ACPG4X_19695 [Pikeienuella sp.]